MAGSAGRVLAVRLEPLSQSGGARQGRRGLKVSLHARRRGRHRNAEDVLHHPFASGDRRGAVGDGGGGKDRPLAEQPAPGAVLGQADTAHIAAVNAGDAVVPRQPLVDEGVVGVQQVGDLAVLLHDTGEQHLGFLAEGVAKVGVEIGHVGLRTGEIAQHQPLTGEVLDQLLGSAVGQHPAHLPVEHRRLVQLVRGGQLQEGVVRQAAPQEEGQPGGQLQVGDVIGPAGLGFGTFAFDAEQEAGVDQHPRDAMLNAALEVTALAPLLVSGHQRLD